MRIGLLTALGFAGLVAGVACIPLIDHTNATRTPRAGQTLVVAIEEPFEEMTVPQGEPIEIQWTGANLTGEPAAASVIVESRDDLVQTTITEGLMFEGVTIDGEYTWDTQGFAGLYAITVRIEASGTAYEDVTDAMITVDPPPTFEFTAPAADVEYEPGDTLTIGWTAGDDGGTARIGLDPDTNHTGGNELFIAEIDLPDPPESDSLDWAGTTLDGDSVEARTYNLFAIASDGVNPDVTIEGLAQITVLEAETPEGLVIVQPEEDTDFLDAATSFTIEYRVNQSEDVLVDVKIDTDDNHANGNEITIDSQRLVEADTDPDLFEWDGTDSAGDPVDDGIYRVFIAVSSGGGTPQTADADGLIFRRPTKDDSLIGLLDPGSATTVDPGDYVTIRWRDDDPEETAKIRITIDDDPDPAEGEPGADDDIAEIEILDERDAAGDGVQDQFSWQVPSTLTPGTYYVFAYIDSDDAAPADHVSVAPATVTVRDPAD